MPKEELLQFEGLDLAQRALSGTGPRPPLRNRFRRR